MTTKQRPRRSQSTNRVTLPEPLGVMTLHWVAKQTGLLARSRKNWTPMLKSLCGKAGIEVRHDDAGVACCRSLDVPKIAELVKCHLDRPRPYARVTIKEQGK